MAYADRSGNTYEHDDLQDRVLKYLYGSMPGGFIKTAGKAVGFKASKSC